MELHILKYACIPEINSPLEEENRGRGKIGEESGMVEMEDVYTGQEIEQRCIAIRGGFFG